LVAARQQLRMQRRVMPIGDSRHIEQLRGGHGLRR
jgi:hypothetical protein